MGAEELIFEWFDWREMRILLYEAGFRGGFPDAESSLFGDLW